jgi:hypothetical protein
MTETTAQAKFEGGVSQPVQLNLGILLVEGRYQGKRFVSSRLKGLT